MAKQGLKKQHAEYEKERRRRNGAVSREEYLRQSSILQREIISLFIDHASKPADIASHLGISRMTVYRALARWNGEFNDDADEGGLSHGHVTDE